MNILFEWIFWIFIKWIIFWTNILILFCPRQKFSLINVSKSSEIIQGSLMGPNSVHFRGSFTYTGASGGLRSHISCFYINLDSEGILCYAAFFYFTQLLQSLPRRAITVAAYSGKQVPCNLHSLQIFIKVLGRLRILAPQWGPVKQVPFREQVIFSFASQKVALG